MDITQLMNEVGDAAPVVAEVLPVIAGRTLHIDGDLLAYFAGGNESMTTSTSKAILLNKVKALKEAAQAQKVLLHMTASGSTKGDRYAVAYTKGYQEQRKSGKRPHNWEFLRNFMLESGHPAFTVKNWHDREADDGCAYIMSIRPQDAVASDDKDFRMFPGLHIVWRGHAQVVVPPGCFDLVADGNQYGDKFFWWQMLRGDTADNIPGLPAHSKHKRGVGEAGATELLGDASNNQEAYDRVVAAYQDYAPGEWDRLFCEQATLLWMRRDRMAHLSNWFAHLSQSVEFSPHILCAANEQEERVALIKKEAYAISQATAVQS